MQQKFPTRLRIVIAARQLFAERGFHGTAIADLAEQAQVSVGTIYRSFSNKSEIIRAIVETDTQETLEKLRLIIEDVRDGSISGPDAIEQLIYMWTSRRSDALVHETMAEAHRNPAVAAVVIDICSKYRDLLRELSKILRPDMSETELEGISEILLACMFGMGNREFTQPHLNAEEASATVMKLILRSLEIPSA